MELIKLLPSRKIKTNTYRFGLFKCPVCGSEVEKPYKDGMAYRRCSHKCYSITRERRGAYTESVIISGYRYIHCPDHPSATQNGYVAEHRLVAEKKIGRVIARQEVVHHINENKLDNRP